jgi:small subunit ribosomal protein S1
VKEDGSFAEVGEALDFRVTEFHKEEKKIVLSHTVGSEDEIAAEEKAKKKEGAKKAKGGEKAKAAESTASTLGDLDVLSALKEKMNDAK